jgi:hypothetical protein
VASSGFDRQVATLVQRGYAQAAALSEGELVESLESVRASFREGSVIVVRRELVDASTSIGLVRRRGKAGFLSLLSAQELASFVPIEAVSLPAGSIYLMRDVEVGADNRNVTPDGALAAILEAGRSPLTIEEGIALVTHFPESVATNGGFSLAGSRCSDRRVCALWISKGAPKLGWCWAGNTHTWLGTASCGARVGV